MKAALANAALLSLFRGGERRFQAALGDPRGAQEAVLQAMVRAHTPSAFGRAHGFHRVRSVDDYRAAVPLGDATTLGLDGDPRSLVAEPILRLQPTGGSTGSSKLIPFTAGLRRRFQDGLAPWIGDLLLRVPGLALGSTWWQVTPPGERTLTHHKGIPVGFADDADYFGTVAARCIRALSAVPQEVGRLPLELWRERTLVHLLARRDLALLSVWNPSFLLLFLDFAATHWSHLLEGVARLDRARARELGPLERLGDRRWERVWPGLVLVSAWGDGAAARDLERLRALLPSVYLQPKGLLATEAFVSLPRVGLEGHVLAAHAFFLEFEAEGRVVGAGELDPGFVGDVVVTNGGGLWRYRLRDRVEVLGHLGRLPRIRFLGRADASCDLVGEKLHEDFVARILARVVGSAWALLAPHTSTAPPAYILHVQHPDAAALANRVEEGLREAMAYDYARRLGQLGPVKPYRIPQEANPQAAFLERSRREGRRLGDVKPAALDRREGWEEWW